MNRSIAVLLVMIAIIAVTLTARCQTVDTLSINGKNTFILMEKHEFSKIQPNVDTCLQDKSGEYLFMRYKGVTYYGISKKEFAKLVKVLPKVTRVKTSLLYSPTINTIWGYRRNYRLY